MREAWKISGLELGREKLEETNSAPQGKGGRPTVTPLLKGNPALGARFSVTCPQLGWHCANRTQDWHSVGRQGAEAEGVSWEDPELIPCAGERRCFRNAGRN